MGKSEKKIGLLYPVVFSSEKHELVTMSLTGDDRFHLIGKRDIDCDLVGLVNWIDGTQKENPYYLWIVDSYGANQGVVDALKERGIPVLSMQDMFKAIDKLVDGDPN